MSVPCWSAALPICPVCTCTLGAEGGPCTLPCGHNGCFYCLRDVQARKPECPLCRQAFPADYPLQTNPVLRQLVTTAMFNAGGHEEDGWESVPTRANAIKMYAHELAGALQTAGAPPRTSAPDATPARTTSSMVRDVAAQHQSATQPGPLAIVTGSYHASQADARYSYESILAWVPPQWMPDSCAPACKSCCLPFKPVMRLRHHCRLCGMVFCHACSSKKLLLPPKFGYHEPERVCNCCYDVLKPADLQNALAGHFSKAAQMPVHDVTDWTSMRAWLNNPITSSLEQDIYKCTNILGHFVGSSRLHAERAIPAALLQNAAGYAILSVLRIGMGWSASVGSGLVVARQQDGSWSPPSAIGLGGFGWGVQAGGELTDLLLVLSNTEAVKAFCGDAHLGLQGNVNVSIGPLGRDATASVCLGKRGCAMVYSYSCSRGAYMGVSIDGTVTNTRATANLAFYGRPLTAKDLLLGGCVDAPPAARTLYNALDTMMNSFGYHALQSRGMAMQHVPVSGQAMALDGTFGEDNLAAAKAASGPPAATQPDLLAVEDLADGVMAMPAPSAPPPPPLAEEPRGMLVAASVGGASEMSDTEECPAFSLFD